MISRKQLEPAIHEAIKVHCAKDDELAAAQQYERAIVEYNGPWELVPDPKTEWSASTSILAAIGDAAFLGGFDILS